jgi:hypothetical protein
MTTRIAFVFVAAAALGAVCAQSAELSRDQQIEKWREEGPLAVDRLMTQRAELLAKHGDASQIPDEAAAELAALNDTIDRVARAKYSHLSGLYWYTDEDAAYAAAKAQKRPILTLRLLGNLDEEYSCANSRYFRQLLYTHEGIRKLLHDRFVLHWKSVRPVPLITVDLQNGMKLQRTITGNSIHYVVLPEGIIVDLFPGLYSPDRFLKGLATAERVAQDAMRTPKPQTVIDKHIASERVRIERAWEVDVKKYEAIIKKHEAILAAQKSLSSQPNVGDTPTPRPDFWESIGSFHNDSIEFGDTTEELIKAEHQQISKAKAAAFPNRRQIKGLGEAEMLQFIFNCLRRDLAIDTLQNEYCIRYELLEIMAKFAQVEEVNQFTYRNMFNCSPDNPWWAGAILPACRTP